MSTNQPQFRTQTPEEIEADKNRRKLEEAQKAKDSKARIKQVGKFEIFKRPGRRTVTLKQVWASRLERKNQRRAVHGLPAIESYSQI